ncbi:DUF3685 domain-containing protein [[Limnothrix rosea] IAM M-220]|uniref:DUF3685 domain-containing protein n=1 Tax=[Limnothrix rosea] IAM M-220 TaxID=454133 RepID=UPI0009655E24|nr:DUF3685 domain-containing protein [[Limnothrix rosea] IAM M-220]OKH19991.1 two-component response regulator ycf55-like protein [[Limnothrix rosea] IAM M-220]
MKLLLVDDDPIFRLGFCTALAQETDWAIAAEPFDNIFGQTNKPTADIILCEPSWQGDENWLRYRELQQIYADIPVVLFTSQLDTERLTQAKQDGIQGYFPKGTAIATIITTLEQIVAGEIVWSQRPQIKKQNILTNLRRRSLGDIYRTLDNVEQYLNQKDVAALNRLVGEGRRRELQAAAWVIRQLLPQASLSIQPLNPPQIDLEPSDSMQIVPLENLGLATTNSRWQTLLEKVYFKLNRNLLNATGNTLETDILSIDKKRELYYIILQQLTQTLNDPQWKIIEIEAFQKYQERSLRSTWRLSTQEFISRYAPDEDSRSEDFMKLLNREAIAILETNLRAAPYTLELFQYLLLEKPLIIDNVEYRLEAQEAIRRSQLILENLLIQLSNSVMQFLLNTFSESEIFKHNLYNKKIRSSREIARFRNELSWQYRREKYWLEPKAIFESQYSLLQFSTAGLVRTSIYAPRHEDLATLEGFAWGVTMILELRDALAPRVRALVAWLGKIVVYVLTNVVGRALGLIARGIADGVGTSWQQVKKRSLYR